MTDITWPSGLVPTAAPTWRLIDNTWTARSSLSGAAQTLELPGARWACALQFDSMGENESALYRKLIAQMRGKANRVNVPYFVRQSPLGVGGGTPRVINPQNLLQQSNLFHLSPWAATGVSVPSSTVAELWYGQALSKLMTEDTSTGVHYIRQSVTMNAGETVTLSAWACQYSGSRPYFALQFASGFFSDATARTAVFDVTDGTVFSITGSDASATITAEATYQLYTFYRCTLTVLLTQGATANIGLLMCDASGNVSYTGASHSTLIYGAQLVKRASHIMGTSVDNTPTGDYVDTTSAAVTNQQNLFGYSEQLQQTSWYSVANGSISVDATAGPDGTGTTADKFVESASLGTHYFRILDGSGAIVAFFEAGKRYTVSFWAKAAERSSIVLSFNSDYIRYSTVTFDLSAITAGYTTTLQVVSADITDVGNSWRFCTATFQIPDIHPAGTQMSVSFDMGTYTGDGTSGLYVWGIQCQRGSVGDNYAQTTSATLAGSYWGQGNTELWIDGCPVSTTGWLKAGDVFSVGGELKMLTDDVDTSATGGAMLHFFPPLRNAVPAGSAVTISSPTVRMMLVGEASWATNPAYVHDGLMEFEESWI